MRHTSANCAGATVDSKTGRADTHTSSAPPRRPLQQGPVGAYDGVLEGKQRLRDPQPGQLRAQHVRLAVQQRAVPEQRQRVRHVPQRSTHPVRDLARRAGAEGDGGEHGVAQPAVPAVSRLVHQPGRLVEERSAGVQHGGAHPGVEVVGPGRSAVGDEGVPVRGRPADHGVHPQGEPHVVQAPEPGRLPVPERSHLHFGGDEFAQRGLARRTACASPVGHCR